MSDIVSAVNHTSGKPGRRLKLLRIDSNLLVALLSNDGSKLMRIDGMPADTRIVGMSPYLYFDQDCWAFQVESAEFPIRQEGCHIETMELTCHSLDRMADASARFEFARKPETFIAHKDVPCDEFLCLPEVNPDHYERREGTPPKLKAADVIAMHETLRGLEAKAE